MAKPPAGPTDFATPWSLDPLALDGAKDAVDTIPDDGELLLNQKVTRLFLRNLWATIIPSITVPIALIVNSLRITVTGVMYMLSPELAEKLFHDWAGYFMMPLALGMLYFEQQLLSWLFVARHPPSLPLSSAMLDRLTAAEHVALKRAMPLGEYRVHIIEYID